MNPATIKAIQDALTPLADKLGQGAEFVFNAYMRQEFVNGFESIVVGAIILIAVLIGANKLLPSMIKKRHKADSFDKGEWNIGISVVSISLVMATAFCVWLLMDGAAHFYNPSFYAIQDIISTVQPHN